MKKFLLATGAVAFILVGIYPSEAATKLTLSLNSPKEPIICMGGICQVAVDISNRSKTPQSVPFVKPFIVTSKGTYTSEVPAWRYPYDGYCTPSIEGTLNPNSFDTANVCIADVPAGTRITKIYFGTSYKSKPFFSLKTNVITK